MKHFDIIIIGAGAVGTSVLYHLTEKGIYNCLLIEKKSSFGCGATGSWGSLIRVMHKNPETTKNAAKSVPFYVNFDEKVGFPCHFNRTGSLYFLKRHKLRSFSEHLSILKTSGVDFHIIDPIIGKKEFPDFYWYEDDVAIYEPCAGNACPYSTTQAFVWYSKRRGANVKLNTSVLEILAKKNKVTGIKTSQGEVLNCEKLVLTAGIWTYDLLKTLGTKVDIFPQVIQVNRFFRRNRQTKVPLFVDKNSRTFGHFFPNGSFVGGYLFEATQINSRQKALEHLSIRDANVAKQRISHRLNWVKNSTLEGGIRAIESYSKDSQGILEYDSKYKNLLISAGWSCTGFTLAPLIGKKITEKL